jgi:hypothetical protein
MNQSFNDLSKYFYIGDEVKNLDKNLFYIPKQELQDSILEKNIQIQNWQNLLENLKGMQNVKIRDVSDLCFLHSYNGLITFLDENEQEIGINFSINFPYKLYSFYFAKFVKQINGRYIIETSYYETDEKILEKKEMIENSIKFFFRHFENFNIAHAEIKIEDLYLEEKFYHNISLWELLFTENKFGII